VAHEANGQRRRRRVRLRRATSRLGAVLPLVVCRFLACVLAAVGVLAIVDRLGGIRDHVTAPSPELGRLVESEPRGGRCSEADPAIVFLTASRLNAQTAILRLDVTLCIGDGLLRKLRTTGPGRSRIWFGPVGDTQFRRPYAERRLTATVKASSDRPLWTGATTLRALSGDVYEPVAMTPATLALPMLAQPDAYPLDAFIADGLEVSVQLPSGVEFPPRTARDVIAGQLPVRVRFATSPAIGDFEFKVHTESSVGAFAQVHIDAQREPATKLFVGVVLVVPLLFVCLLAVAFQRRAGTEGAPGLRDLFLGLIGTTLALLPLRQVLVPSGLTALTLVDWYLASVVLLCAAIALWWAPRAS